MPTQGKDTAQSNAALLLRTRELFGELGIPVSACSSDGAANEVGAHDIINASPLAKEHLVFDLAEYGLHLQVPVFEKTGPLVTVPDPGHVRKVKRNHEQTGTHCVTIGDNFLGQPTLMSIQQEEGSGMRKRDVVSTDKQDDGAAIRLYHANALRVCTTPEGGVKPEYRLPFVMHFVFGTSHSCM
jgi:hypothetical protein